ncbi:hypothetical protein ABKA04_006589 [Annulohypoxylon sp. FPYF3050]
MLLLNAAYAYGQAQSNGERLWAVILQARPELEDIVLQILRGGTYANTGVPNLEYFRNNDNQAELVNYFNESRLGRFLQNGESPDLLLPPINQHVSPMIAQVRSEMGFGQSANSHRQQGVAKSMSGQSNRSASISQSSPANPHGAPQDPGDIYIQSEDIRRRVFHNQSQINSYFLGLPEDLSNDISPNHTPSNLTAAQGTTPYSNGTVDGYGASTQQVGNDSAVDRQMSVDTSMHISEHLRPAESNNLPTASFEHTQFHLDETSRWLDSTPFDTLRNLGFAPGDRMAEDFLELCENPDPIDHTPATSADQDEDEEAVWRRLVMRGRFI